MNQKPALSNLQLRILAAAIYFPAILVSAHDPRWFSYSILILCGCCWHEYLTFRKKPSEFRDWVLHFSQVVLSSSPVLLYAFNMPFELGVALLMFALLVKIIVDLSDGKDLAAIQSGLSFHFLGIIYITGLFSILNWIESYQSGKQAIWFLFFIVGMTDTAAYFCGRYFGRNPFFQHISPKKTQEGAWGGLAGAAIVGILFWLVFPRYDFITPNLFLCMLLAIGVGGASIFGDLFESLLKRTYGVKDSGNLIPGHGGVLDRFDGVMAAAIPLFFFMALRGGFR